MHCFHMKLHQFVETNHLLSVVQCRVGCSKYRVWQFLVICKYCYLLTAKRFLYCMTCCPLFGCILVVNVIKLI